MGLFPAIKPATPDFVPDGEDGIFKLYAAREPIVHVSAQVHKTSGAEADPPLRMGKKMLGKKVVLAPEDSDFKTAATWSIHVPCTEPQAGKLFLRINYEGDVARLYVDGKMLTDNFFNGAPWDIGLERVPCKQWDQLVLKILPLRNHAPIYLPEGARPGPSASGQTVKLNQVLVVPEYAAVLDVAP